MRRFPFLMCLTAMSFLPVVGVPHLVHASDAYVQADSQKGQGRFRGVNEQCFFITPAHVVEGAMDLTVSTSSINSFGATLTQAYPDDVAILKVKTDDAGPCAGQDWNDGSDVSALLGVYGDGVLQRKLPDGSTQKVPVNILSYDQTRMIMVKPVLEEDVIAKGFSGSTLFVAEKPVGMLLSVQGDAGHVLRQDALNNVIALFFNQDSGESVAKADKTGPLLTNEGTLAKDATQEYEFFAKDNSPLVFTNYKADSRLRYDARIYDKNDKEVFRWNGLQASYDYNYGFVVPEEGTYKLKLFGTSEYGAFKNEITLLAMKDSLINDANVLELDKSVSGKLAEDAIAEYKFIGKENSPLLFTFYDSGTSLEYRADVYNQHEEHVFELDSYIQDSNNNDGTAAFTPKEDGVYILKLKGTRKYGDFKIGLTQMNTNDALKNDYNILKVGDFFKQELAEGAETVYKIALEANTPIRINFYDTDYSLNYSVQILDRKGNAVYKASSRYASDEYNDSLTVEESGDYKIIVKGLKNYGPVKIGTKELVRDEALRNEKNVIEVGGVIDNKLARDAVAEYRFQGQKNTPLEFEFLDKKSDLDYKVFVMQGSSELKEWGTFDANSEYLRIFTPKEDGEYMLRILGASYYGDFGIALEQVVSNDALINENNVISPETPAENTLADEAVAEYKFSAEQNTPLEFKFHKHKTNLDYYAYIINEQGEELERWGELGGDYEYGKSFTASQSGTYTLRLIGSELSGPFKVEMNVIGE